jgi:DNA-binding IclR family transcriptional regulator
MRRDPVKSTARTLEILELFNAMRRPLRLNEIFASLSYPQSSTTSLLRSMVSLGYLNYNRGARVYFPTPKVEALGSWIHHQVFGEGELLDLIQSVFDAVQETVVIWAQNDIYVQHLRVLEAPDADFPPFEGGMKTLNRSAAGLALMSRLPAGTIDTLTRHIRYYENERIDMDELADQLNWTAQEGYSMLARSPAPEFTSLAIALQHTRHAAPLALGVQGPNSRIARKRTQILSAMRGAIADYEVRLGQGHAPILRSA